MNDEIDTKLENKYCCSIISCYLTPLPSEKELLSKHADIKRVLDDYSCYDYSFWDYKITLFYYVYAKTIFVGCY